MGYRWLIILSLGLVGALAAILLTVHPRPPSVNGHDMVWIPAGTFNMGDSFGVGYPEDGETPVHRVTLSGFWIDRFEATNAQFTQFVEESGYQTEAEEFGWSGVPAVLLSPEQRAKYPPDTEGRWEAHWRKVDGASWKHPEGPGSSISTRMNHPAVHISWNDAIAYSAWLSEKSGQRYRLPTEAEWECAARGGLAEAKLPWGNDVQQGGRWLANLWQGPWPDRNTGDDGFVGTAPAGTFSSNGHGLFDVSGNVWEWCSDWFDPQYYQVSPPTNPSGPSQGVRKVQRGGSYLCCDECCRRYRVAARFHNDPDSGMANAGFRCVRER